MMAHTYFQGPTLFKHVSWKMNTPLQKLATGHKIILNMNIGFEQKVQKVELV